MVGTIFSITLRNKHELIIITYMRLTHRIIKVKGIAARSNLEIFIYLYCLKKINFNNYFDWRTYSAIPYFGGSSE